MSVRATARFTSVSKPTILRLLLDLGAVCAEYQDRHLRFLPCRRIQCDEIHAFVRAKEHDVWTWVAFSPDTKLVPCWLVGPRNDAAAKEFMADLADRLDYRIQLTTDGFWAYEEAAMRAFGKGGVDFAMLVKDFGKERNVIREIEGEPDPRYVSTSLVERQNLTMRMSMRRFTRKTNAHSKKLLNHAAAIALHYMHYNFARPHESLWGVSPAQAAGVSDHLWSIEDMVALLERNEEIDSRVSPIG